jgi:ABC-2 type transport system ATP-binding protein
MSDVIEIRGLWKQYEVGFWKKRKITALQPLELTVREGEIFGYLGPNGAGKTTTLKLLMGLAFPSGGGARILGLDHQDPAVKAQIGFLPEQPYFYDHLSATELLEYFAQLSGVPAGERKRRVERMLARVGLGDAGGLQLRRFSKGMLQRVGLAQAILHDPKVVFLDEPMSGLDPIGRREVRDLVQQLKEEGRTVFFSTHILSDAEALCDRVAILNRGRVVTVGEVADMLAKVSESVEVLWEGAAAVAGIEALGAAVHASGELARASVPRVKLDAAIDALRGAGARLISVTPVQATLEDYFMQQVGASEAAAAEARA